MQRLKYIIAASALTGVLSLTLSAQTSTPCDECERLREIEAVDLDSLKSAIHIDSAISEYYLRYGNSRIRMPLIYSGYMSVRPFRPEVTPIPFTMKSTDYDRDSLRYAGILTREPVDSTLLEEGDEILELKMTDLGYAPEDEEVEEIKVDLEAMKVMPDWLRTSLHAQKMQRDLAYLYMVSHPWDIDYAAWNIPAPPTLPEEDYSYTAFLESLDLPEIDTADAILPEFQMKRRYWLHTVGTGLHVSQAYVSSNWYQGGNTYLSLLFNFNWDASLNTIFHPNLMFDSNLSYKLAINTNPRGSIHKYSISQDQFQYNLKAGLKAWQKWFYSVNLQFKTQFFNAYPADSPDLTAAFLSPADLNIGLGMTYNTTGRNNTLKFSASISPISYNLKACLSDRIDVTQFNIEPGRHTHSEIGSNAELNLEWAITNNISWKSRLFLFSDYTYFLADWENTFNFTINRFLSTQLYVYPRYDSSSDFNSSRWHYWMLKEVLSIGITYVFSTKP